MMSGHVRKILILCLAAATVLPSRLRAECPQAVIPASPAAKERSPAKGADIIAFRIDAENEGPLRIIYSDGTVVEIPKEKGRFESKGEALAQARFSDIQVADDRRHIGWLAEYMVCAQSYPCPAVLVVYRSGRKPTYIFPSYGIVWHWRFSDMGSGVVVQFGFPHGDDTGTFARFDADTGRKLAEFSLKDKKGPLPPWVRRFRESEKGSGLD